MQMMTRVVQAMPGHENNEVCMRRNQRILRCTHYRLISTWLWWCSVCGAVVVIVVVWGWWWWWWCGGGVEVVLWWCGGGVEVVLWWCGCGVVVVVVWWLCSSGIVMWWWCSDCGGVSNSFDGCGGDSCCGVEMWWYSGVMIVVMIEVVETW